MLDALGPRFDSFESGVDERFRRPVQNVVKEPAVQYCCRPVTSWRWYCSPGVVNDLRSKCFLSLIVITGS